MKPLARKLTVKEQSPMILVDFLANETQLSKEKIKKILGHGGVWKSGKRVRRAQAPLVVGEKYEIYYDPQIKFPPFDEPRPLKNLRDYGVWFKPSGVLSQGTLFGDDGSMLRALEKKIKDVYLIQRLDRETAGLMIFAYHKRMAAKLSELWKAGKVQKYYLAVVRGETEKSGEITYPLEDKEAKTTYRTLEFFPESNTSLVEVQIHTGRTHQIRKHFDMINHPVMGDPKYGKDNKNDTGLKLLAHRLVIPDISLDICLDDNEIKQLLF